MGSLPQASGMLAAGNAAAGAIPHASAESVYVMPATQGQVRFWSLDQLDPGNPGLNMPLMWQFTGPLNIPTLHAAFQSCVERHEMLRTTFSIAEGRLSQIINTDHKVALPIVDLSALTGEDQRTQCDRLTKQHAAIRMDLKRGPLLQLQLLHFNEERHILLVTMHHIICDGISLGILMRDMLAFYEGTVHATEPRLPELPIQFGDYAVWQDEWRKGEEAAASRKFWHHTLGSHFPGVTLPLDAKPTEPSQTTLTGDIETLLVPRDLTTRAHAFCLRENVTFNMLLFSVFVALISRITNEAEFTVGSPCANRTEDTEELIGLFMNIQVFRAQIAKQATFLDILQQVRNWTLGAYENQTLPFEDLVHDPFFAEGSDAFQIPIFFLYQPSFMKVRRIGELEVIPLRSESPGAVFDVMFAIVDREEEGPRLQLEFDPCKHTTATVQRWLRLYINLLASSISLPTEQVKRLNAISPAERQSLLVNANKTHRDFGPFRSVASQLLAQAQRFPDRTAIECDGKHWSYSQLLDYAQRLAQQLISEGVRTGDLVAVAVERSMEMVGAVLAVLFTGAAYVPLDPRHPRERLELVLADSQPVAILQNGSLQLTSSARILDVRGPLPPAPQPPLLASFSSETLAYVIYTSGTTGVPKGVAIQRGSVFNLFEAMKMELGITADDTLVAVTTLSFDIAALELFLPLVTGARLVLATDDEVHDPDALLTLLKRNRATVMQATPGAWRALIDAGWDAGLPLKVLCGGEALSRALADKLLERSNDVWNMYGPTETTIWSAATRVTTGTAKPRIGNPIANTQFYVLDREMLPVPIGFDGELYIGGDGLAQGYWNKPELTVDRFVESPFQSNSESPTRLYKTGDLARWHPDGSLELLGRTDFQVKRNGYRIELGEIEASLLQHPDIREAVVLYSATEDTPKAAGVTRLLAYVEAGDRASDAALIHELEDQIKKALPDYMVPNVIVALRELPRNTNGKVDRSSLPEVVSQPGSRGFRAGDAPLQRFVPPRDVFERQLAEIWQTTLGIPRISIRASFFSLGVNSLAALRLITKMNRIYGTDLGLATLLSASTIESVAELIRTRFSPNTDSPVVPIKPNGTRPPLFIIHGIGGNVISFHGLAQRLGDDQPVYGIQAQGLLSGKPGVLHLQDMAAEYVRAVQATQPCGPYHFLGYSFGGTVALEMAHQLRAAGEHVALLSMLDAKSTVYWRAVASNQSVKERAGNRADRFRGNIDQLDRKSQAAYIWRKILTRARRITYLTAMKLGLRQIPNAIKDAEDLNRVAVNHYILKPYNGAMTLFRAAEQWDGDGPHDLGWSGFFTSVTVREIAGDHERMFLEPMVETLATLLRENLQDRNIHDRAA